MSVVFFSSVHGIFLFRTQIFKYVEPTAHGMPGREAGRENGTALLYTLFHFFCRRDRVAAGGECCRKAFADLRSWLRGFLGRREAEILDCGLSDLGSMDADCGGTGSP